MNDPGLLWVPGSTGWRKLPQFVATNTFQLSDKQILWEWNDFQLCFKIVCQILWIETNLLWTFSQMTSSECRAAVRPEEKQLAAVCDHKYIRTNSNIWTIIITKVSGQIHLNEYILNNLFRQSLSQIYWDKYAETWSFLIWSPETSPISILVNRELKWVQTLMNQQSQYKCEI